MIDNRTLQNRRMICQNMTTDNSVGKTQHHFGPSTNLNSNECVTCLKEDDIKNKKRGHEERKTVQIERIVVVAPLPSTVLRLLLCLREYCAKPVRVQAMSAL